MRSDFAQASFVHHDDSVGALDGGEAVRYNDGGAAFHQTGERGANAEFGFSVDAGSSLVQDQVARVVRQSARETDELLLTSGETRAPFANRLSEAFWQCLDKVEQIDALGGVGQLADPKCPQCRAGCCPRWCR